MRAAAQMAGDAAYRAHLVACAKAVAVPVAASVAASLPPSRLLDSMTRDELAALVIVLAEGADPDRLSDIVTARDEPATDGELLVWPDPEDVGYGWRREAALEFGDAKGAVA
jgi:hypothetical protein